MDEPHEPAPAHRFTVAAELEMVGSLRDSVARLVVDAGADDTVVDDLTLAVSELATNVVQHSDAADISVSVRHEPGRWVLDVDHADSLAAVDTPVPAADALSGRGLLIVRSIMDEVEIVEDGGHRVLRCSRLVG